MQRTEGIAYFASPGAGTDVSRHASLLADLPDDPAGLAQITRGLLLHNFTAEIKGIASSPERNAMAIFGAASTIDRIVANDPSPLDEPRAEELRVIGFCYHFALVHCALLRASGIASRARCGFANYLIPNKWTDHWAVEYWDGQQWRLSDPQIGLDEVSSNDFVDGVRSWQRCRAGETDPADHGNGELWGWDELRGSLVNDIGALNKVEAGDWDWCQLLQVEPLDQPHAELDARLDDLAALASPNHDLADLHAAYNSDAALHPPLELFT